MGDDLTPRAVVLDSAISTDAPVSIVFAWLRHRDLAVGQPFVRIFGRTYVFELAAFKTDEHITLQPRAGSLMSRSAR